MEIVIVKVRPCYLDKKLHVLRFLFSDGMFELNSIYNKLQKIFPFGFYRPKIERYMIDYAFSFDNDEFEEICNHDYLAIYLNSEKKLE